MLSRGALARMLLPAAIGLGVLAGSTELDAYTEPPTNAQVGHGEVTLEASNDSSGSNQTPAVSNAGSDTVSIPVVNLRCGEGFPLGCKLIGTPPPKATDATGPISITDIATFRPQPPGAAMQPNQWMIVGLDTNFYATTSAHIVDGTLFGGTAQVRFTPISFSWDYGDGSTATTSNPGRTWANYRIPEFDPTPTSHVYQESGDYIITLVVTYTAEYRVAGSNWQNVVGTLSIVAPPLTATAGHATTVLVDQNCNTNPNGIGC